MECFIYKGKNKPDTYLYITADAMFSQVPDALLTSMGNLEKVMSLTLDGGRKLANADTIAVIEQLISQGYYLQLPPGTDLMATS